MWLASRGAGLARARAGLGILLQAAARSRAVPASLALAGCPDTHTAPARAQVVPGEFSRVDSRTHRASALPLGSGSGPPRHNDELRPARTKRAGGGPQLRAAAPARRRRRRDHRLMARGPPSWGCQSGCHSCTPPMNHEPMPAPCEVLVWRLWVLSHVGASTHEEVECASTAGEGNSTEGGAAAGRASGGHARVQGLAVGAAAAAGGPPSQSCTYSAPVTSAYSARCSSRPRYAACSRWVHGLRRCAARMRGSTRREQRQPHAHARQAQQPPQAHARRARQKLT